MSLTTALLDGLRALSELPGGGYTAASVVAAGGGALIYGAWHKANPHPINGAARPLLTMRPLYSPPPPVDEAAMVAPLDIPLDVIPRNDRGRTPYEIVGVDTLAVIVDQFYSKVCADPTLADYFTGVDMARLKRHQVLFIGQLWGGPVHFPLEQLAIAHQRLSISPERYWRVAGHLMVTLTHLSVPDWICIFTMTRLYQARTLIVAREWQPAEERPPVTDVTVTAEQP